MTLPAYLAGALTSLSPEERKEIDLTSNAISATCRKAGFELYEPRNITDPVHHPGIADSAVFHQDRMRVADSTVVILIADFPSLGAGQELLIAQQYLVPVIVAVHVDRPLSRMVSGMPGVVRLVKYRTLSDLQEQLQVGLFDVRTLKKDRPDIRSTMARSNAFGENVSRLRAERGWSRAELANRVNGGGVVHENDIEQWENSSDLDNNPSLALTSSLAAALGVSAASLLT